MIDDAIITIRGNEVIVNSNAYRQYNFKTDIPSLKAALTGGNMMESGLLPPAIRWISPDRNTFLLERPPLFAPIFYTPTSKMEAIRIDREQKNHYNIPIPWQVYIVTIKPSVTISSYFRPSSLSSLEDELYIIPLPNVAGFAGGFCKPAEWSKDAAEMFENDNVTIAELIGFASNYMWTCNFNNNAGSRVSQGPKELPGDDWGTFLAAWEKLSPHQALELSWIAANKTIMDLIKDNVIGAFGYDYDYGTTREQVSGTIAYDLATKKN